VSCFAAMSAAQEAAATEQFLNLRSLLAKNQEETENKVC